MLESLSDQVIELQSLTKLLVMQNRFGTQPARQQVFPIAPSGPNGPAGPAEVEKMEQVGQQLDFMLKSMRNRKKSQVLVFGKQHRASTIIKSTTTGQDNQASKSNLLTVIQPGAGGNPSNRAGGHGCSHCSHNHGPKNSKRGSFMPSYGGESSKRGSFMPSYADSQLSKRGSFLPSYVDDTHLAPKTGLLRPTSPGEHLNVDTYQGQTSKGGSFVPGGNWGASYDDGNAEASVTRDSNKNYSKYSKSTSALEALDRRLASLEARLRARANKNKFTSE